ncbi:MAG: Asp-tRNA(Asn)/Glu-tRNA(Gln) amidotransferase subunit GatC [bacterium]
MRDEVNDGIDVGYVAKLARLDLTDEELRSFQEQLRDIVGYVRKVQELDVGSVEPMSHGIPISNVFRSDVPGSSLLQETVLKNAPSHREGQFIVPKIVE